jgi:hypothetical protein
MATCATQTVLSFEMLAKQNPTVTFCHVYPGFVNTGQLDRLVLTIKGKWRYVAEVARWTLIPVLSWLLATTVEVAGEKGFFTATSAKYPPSALRTQAGNGSGMVEVPDGVEIAESSFLHDGRASGVYRLDQNCESVRNDCDKVLDGYRQDGMGQKIWEETLNVWERALGTA